MQLLIENKGTLAGGLLFVAGLFAYKTFFSDVGMQGAPAASAQALGADLIKVADDISKATLSSDLFSTAGYRLLSDWSTPLLPEPVGRPNPFAPVGRD
jgi:hypothetical protein